MMNNNLYFYAKDNRQEVNRYNQEKDLILSIIGSRGKILKIIKFIGVFKDSLI